jgi:hypothetical protein
MKLLNHFFQAFGTDTFAVDGIDLECQVRWNIDIGTFARENIIGLTFKFISASGAFLFHYRRIFYQQQI